MILDALGTPASFQGKNIRQEDFAGLLHEIVTSVSARLPEIQKAAINSFADLSQFLASCVPQVPADSATCPVLRLSRAAEDLLEGMGLRYEPIDRFFHGAGWGGVRIGDFTAKLFADASLEGKKQVLEVFTLVRELLREQGLCVLTEKEKANPDLPSCGLYSKITLHNFYEILRSAGAELLVVHNNNQAFGVSLYHNKGTRRRGPGVSWSCARSPDTT